MTDTQIPDTIKHLDFDPELEEKKEESHLCRVLKFEPRKHKCLRPAVYLVAVEPPCGDSIPGTYVCDLCWETNGDEWQCATCKTRYSMQRYMVSLAKIR